MVVRSVTDIDHNGIKNSLKTFLKSQQEFSDYDFEGSGLNILLDVLAYNTHFTSFYANMIANEMFIDSASMRASVTSLAKMFGYIPRSATLSRARLQVQFNNVVNSPPNISIPKNTKFTAIKDGVNYVFYTDKDYNALASKNYKIDSVDIFEGKRMLFKYEVNSQFNQKYVIPNDNVDIFSLKVYVQDSETSSRQDIYQPGISTAQYSPNSLIYFIEENNEGKYEIYFGQNIYGKEPLNGNIVYIEYTICAGSASNDIGTFYAGSSISGYNNFTLTVLEKSNSGADRETIESIRKLAPKSIQVQNRAITAEDYRTLILRDYPNVSDVKVWGGEEASPLQYGKVFITLLPKPGFTITKSIKEFVVNQVIKPYNITTILPEIVDAQYVDIIPTITVTYQQDKTRLTRTELENRIRDNVTAFSTNFLNRFDKSFLYSKFVSQIDNTDASFISNETSYVCRIKKTPFIGLTSNYIFDFKNEVMQGTILSDGFVLQDSITYYIDDSGNNLRLFKIVNNNKIYVDNNVGTVDYSKGLITVKGLNFLSGSEFSMKAKPKNQNFVSKQENVIRIQQIDTNITMIGA